MDSVYINICPNNTYGLSNQLYSIAGICYYATENNIKYIYLNKFLKQIKTENYCNISEIIDLKKTNSFLKKYNIILFVGFNLKLEIVSLLFKYGSKTIDFTEIAINKFKNENSFIINKQTNIHDLISYKNNNLYEKNSLLVEFKIDDTIFNYSLDILPSGYLIQDILINLNNLTFDTTVIPQNNGTPKYFDILRNISFSEFFLNTVNNYIIKNIDTSKKINVIHLRLEEDAIEHWAKENNYEDLTVYKKKVSEIYIEIIKKYFDKNDLTILLCYDYNNDVVNFMRENSYLYIKTPKFDSNRDISAIYDMHIGQFCNNIYLCVFESSFSYTILARINNKKNMKIINLLLNKQEYEVYDI